MPLPDDRGDPAMPANLAAIVKEMERTYITNEQWCRATEAWWRTVADVDAPLTNVVDDG